MRKSINHIECPNAIRILIITDKEKRKIEWEKLQEAVK